MLEVKLDSVDNSTAVAICGKYQTVSPLTVIVIKDKTWYHPKSCLTSIRLGNPETLFKQLVHMKDLFFSSLLILKNFFSFQGLNLNRIDIRIIRNDFSINKSKC